MMRKPLLTATCLLLLSSAVSAQPATTQATIANGMATAMDVDFNHISLEQAIDYFRDQTGQNIVLARDPGVASDQPVIEQLRLKHVSPEDALDVLSKTLKHVTIDRSGDVTIVRVTADNELFGGGSHRPTVRVFNLQRLVTDKHLKLDDVLSLIQSALFEQGGEQARLQIHPPTNMLIVKGTTEQQNIVEAAVDALNTTVDDKTSEELTKAYDRIQALQSELVAARAKLMGAAPTAPPPTTR